MTLSWRRIRSIVRKEFREYRRNRSVIVDDGDLPAHLPHPAGRPGQPAVGIDVRRPRPVAPAAVHARHPDLHTGHARGLCGRRRAGTGQPRACPDDADPPRGVPARQGAGSPRPVDRRGLRGLRARFSPGRCSSPQPAVASAILHGPGHRGAIPVHATARLPVHLGRDRDLDAIERRPRGPAADASREHPGRPRDVAHRVQRHRAEPPPRGRASRSRCSPPTLSAGGWWRRCSTASDW